MEELDLNEKEFNKWVYSDLESMQVAMGYDPVMDCLFTHTFLSDEYVRTITFPKEQYEVGEVYKKDCEYHLSKGTLAIYDPQDETTITLTAPSYGLFKAESRRLYHSFETCVLTTIHKTEAKTISKAEKDILSDRFNSREVDAELSATQLQH